MVGAAPPTAAAPPPPTALDASDRATLGEGLKRRLEELTGTPGVRFAVLADREGFIIETAGELTPGADEVAGALASCQIGRASCREKGRSRCARDAEKKQRYSECERCGV